jgi:putative oxidoreductase
VPLPLVLLSFSLNLSALSGIFARIASAAILLLMAGAIATVHAQFGFFMNRFGQQKGEGFEYHLLAIGLAVAVLVRGAGVLSIDRLLLNGKRELNPIGTSNQTVPSPSQLAQ